MVIRLRTFLMLLWAVMSPVGVAAEGPAQALSPLPVFNFHVVAEGVYRSGQPDSEADWRYLEEIGITTIVKLNKYSSAASAEDEFRMARAHHITVVPVYMQPEDFPHNWNLWAKPDFQELMRAVKLLEDRGHGKVLVHCSHGKDRTGLVVAIFSVRNRNLCKDAAYAEMKHYGANQILFGVKPALYNPAVVENPACRNELK